MFTGDSQQNDYFENQYKCAHEKQNALIERGMLSRVSGPLNNRNFSFDLIKFLSLIAFLGVMWKIRHAFTVRYACVENDKFLRSFSHFGVSCQRGESSSQSEKNCNNSKSLLSQIHVEWNWLTRRPGYISFRPIVTSDILVRRGRVDDARYVDADSADIDRDFVHPYTASATAHHSSADTLPLQLPSLQWQRQRSEFRTTNSADIVNVALMATDGLGHCKCCTDGLVACLGHCKCTNMPQIRRRHLSTQSLRSQGPQCSAHVTEPSLN